VGVIMKKNFTNIARNLRKQATKAETLLWGKLKMRQMQGFKFRRQQPIGPYIIDFVTFEKKLIIELDGGQHAIEREKDEKRDAWLKEQGYEVLRFWDNQVLENLDGVLEVIKNKILSPSPNPSPKGRGIH
jgi:very-short-patch-repair endonuclease